MRFVDLHCDTLLACYTKNWTLRENPGHIDVSKLKAGDALAQCFAIYVPWNKSAERMGLKDTPYEYFQNAYAAYQRELEAVKDVLRPALCYDDIIENEKNGFISSILTLEDCVHLDGQIERVDELFEKGVRIASIIWNWENTLGYPNNKNEYIMHSGLKPFGHEALNRMNELGIIADVSHLSDGGFWDIVKYGKQPFVATHSCARALCDHTRNLTDDMLKALGEKGGVVGINFADMFLDANSNGLTKIEYIVKHLRHMADKAGIEAVAMGSDFDGIGSTLEFNDYSGMPKIADALKACFTEAEIDKISRSNALRVIKECCKKA